MVEPSIVKKTKTRTRVHDEGGGISHEEAEGQRTRNKDERIRGTIVVLFNIADGFSCFHG